MVINLQLGFIFDSSIEYHLTEKGRAISSKINIYSSFMHLEGAYFLRHFNTCFIAGQRSRVFLVNFNLRQPLKYYSVGQEVQGPQGDLNATS